MSLKAVLNLDGLLRRLVQATRNRYSHRAFYSPIADGWFFLFNSKKIQSKVIPLIVPKAPLKHNTSYGLNIMQDHMVIVIR